MAIPNPKKTFNPLLLGSCLQPFVIDIVAPLFCSSVGVKPNTWKSWDLESSETPECSELDSKGKNTSHWGVLGVIGKVLKRRYRKLAIWTSAAQVMGKRRAGSQTVGNRCLPDVRFGSAIRR